MPTALQSETDPQKVELHGLRRRSVALAGLILLAAAGFVVTYLLTSANQRWHSRLATRWNRRGEQQMTWGHPNRAVEALRSSLYYAPDDQEARYRMALALEAAGRPEEAKAYLKALWQDSPESGPYNIELAHIYANEHDTGQAVQYFHGAIYGQWPAGSGRSLQAQIELVQFLFAAHLSDRAHAELVLLAGKLPRKPELYMQVAGMVVHTGDEQFALQLYQEAYAMDHRNANAALQTGLAAFQLDRYGTAERFLQRAIVLNPRVAEASAPLKQIRLALAMSPYARGLTGSERARRGVKAFETIASRLKACVAAQNAPFPNAPLAAGTVTASSGSSTITLEQEWQQMKRSIRLMTLRRDPELVNQVMDLAQQVETVAGKSCGNATETDIALQKIAVRREELDH